MKKILSLIIALSLLMSLMLVSCKKETAETLVNGAMAKIDGHEAVEIDAKIEMAMSMMGMEFEMPIELKVQTAEHGAKSYSLTTVSDFGQTESAETYAEGDWVYALTNGVGTKMSREKAEEKLRDLSFINFLTGIAPEAYEGVEITKNEDGTKSVELTVNKDQLGGFYAGLVEGLTESAGGDSSDVTVSDANIKISVKGGEISGYTMSFDVTITMMGIEAAVECIVECDYVAFDDDVKITPPEGYLDFPEV